MPTEVTQAPLRNSPAGGDNSDIRDQTAGVTEQAQEKAQQAADHIQNTAAQAAGQAQDRFRAQIDQRSAQAAKQINEQASDLRSVSSALRDEGKDGPADAADRLARYAERVGGYLREKDSGALLADAEEFGRQRPWAAAAGGLAAGFAASRFLKASSSRRYQQSRASSEAANREDVPEITFTGEGTAQVEPGGRPSAGPVAPRADSPRTGHDTGV